VAEDGEGAGAGAVLLGDALVEDAGEELEVSCIALLWPGPRRFYKGAAAAGARRDLCPDRM
jgi:hypothetical protein